MREKLSKYPATMTGERLEVWRVNLPVMVYRTILVTLECQGCQIKRERKLDIPADVTVETTGLSFVCAQCTKARRKNKTSEDPNPKGKRVPIELENPENGQSEFEDSVQVDETNEAEIRAESTETDEETEQVDTGGRSTWSDGLA